eukprot:Hpha_TRINITY_DN15343_c1_g2::TRINITY_DN15343_c1_g2_i1::g.88293::m.88293
MPVQEATIEEKKRRLSMNQGLKQACMTAEEQLVQLITPHQSAQETWGAITSKEKEASSALRELLQETDLAPLCEFDPDRCARDCCQQLSDDSLQTQLNPPTVQQRLSELQRLSRATAYIGANKPPKPGAPPELLEDATLAAQEIEALARACTQGTRGLDMGQEMIVNVEPVGSVAEAAVRVLKDAMGVTHRSLDTRLSESREQTRRFGFDAEHSLEQQRTLFADGEVASAERKYYDALQSLESCCNTISQQQGIVDTFEAEVIGETARRTQDAFHACRNAVDEHLEKVAGRKAIISTDLDNLLETVAQGESDHNEYMQRYQEEVATSEGILEQNTKRQQEVWAQMVACERELARFARERYTEVQRRIQNFEQCERHKHSYEQFVAWSRGRSSLLGAAIEHCDLTETVLKRTSYFAQARCHAAETHLETLSERLNKTRIEIHEEYLSHFQQLYLTAGDLLHKKEQVVCQIEAGIQETQLKLEVCQESLNPEAKLHAAKRKELQSTRSRLEDQLHVLQRQQTQYLEWFEPTQRALCIEDGDSRHPATALEEKNMARRAKLEAYNALIVRGEDDGPLMIADAKSDSRSPLRSGSPCSPPAIREQRKNPPAGVERSEKSMTGRTQGASPPASLPSLDDHSSPLAASSAASRRLIPPPVQQRVSGTPATSRPGRVAGLSPQPPSAASASGSPGLGGGGAAAGGGEEPCFNRLPLAGAAGSLRDWRAPPVPGTLTPTATKTTDPGALPAALPNRAASVPGGRRQPAALPPRNSPELPGGRTNELGPQPPLPPPPQQQRQQQQPAGRGWGDGRSCDARADALLKAVGL